jgi:excisionase family DNA binding protein
MSETIIYQKLDNIERMLVDLSIQQKEVLNLKEACQFLDISASHLYKLTSTRQIPHFCPQGKKLYFERETLKDWLTRNPVSGFVTGNHLRTKKEK